MYMNNQHAVINDDSREVSHITNGQYVIALKEFRKIVKLSKIFACND